MIMGGPVCGFDFECGPTVGTKHPATIVVVSRRIAFISTKQRSNGHRSPLESSRHEIKSAGLKPCCMELVGQSGERVSQYDEEWYLIRKV
jgi:hypothetical protein